jgi:hypothetical protein
MDIALAAYSRDGFFYVTHLPRHRTSIFKVISERNCDSTSECPKGVIKIQFDSLLRFDTTILRGAQSHNLPEA